MPEEWNEVITVSVYKKGDKSTLFIRRVIKQTVEIIETISLFSSTYKILSNILLSRLTPYAQEIIGDYQCGF